MRTFVILFAILPSVFLFHFASAEIVEKIVVIVNDEIVTLSDLDTYRKKIRKGGLVDDALLKISDSKKLLKNRKALVQHIIDDRILDSEVKKLNLTTTIERVEQEIRSIAKGNNINRSQLKAALREKGVLFSDYQNFIKKSIERQSLIQKEITSKIKISDEDVSAYYLKEKGHNNAQIYEYSLAHILFLPTNGGEAAAKQRAKKVLAKISSNENFETLASKYSEDPRFAQGGFLGDLKAGEMFKELEQAVRSIPVGATTGIIKSRAGFHIVKLRSKKLVTDPGFEREKDRIRQILSAKAFNTHFRNWLDQKRQDSFIRIN